jgi:hypothetical protein
MKEDEMTDVKRRPKKAIALVAIFVLLGAGFGFRAATKSSGGCRTKKQQILTEQEVSTRNSMTALVVVSTYRWLDSSTQAMVKKRVLEVVKDLPNEPAKVTFSETEMKIANYFDLNKGFREEITKSIVEAVANPTTPQAQEDRGTVQRLAAEATAIGYEQGKCLPTHMFDRESDYTGWFS